MSYSDAIQNALVELVRDRAFPTISHSVAAVGQLRSTSAVEWVRPATAVATRVRQLFANPRRNRRDGRLREVVTEEWSLHIEFNRDISIDEFESELLAANPVIPRNPAAGIVNQITLLVEESTILRSPVTQQPAQGTKVTFRFTAEFTPS